MNEREIIPRREVTIDAGEFASQLQRGCCQGTESFTEEIRIEARLPNEISATVVAGPRFFPRNRTATRPSILLSPEDPGLLDSFITEQPVTTSAIKARLENALRLLEETRPISENTHAAIESILREVHSLADFAELPERGVRASPKSVFERKGLSNDQARELRINGLANGGACGTISSPVCVQSIFRSPHNISFGQPMTLLRPQVGTNLIENSLLPVASQQQSQAGLYRSNVANPPPIGIITARPPRFSVQSENTQASHLPARSRATSHKKSVHWPAAPLQLIPAFGLSSMGESIPTSDISITPGRPVVRRLLHLLNGDVVESAVKT